MVSPDITINDEALALLNAFSQFIHDANEGKGKVRDNMVGACETLAKLDAAKDPAVVDAWFEAFKVARPRKNGTPIKGKTWANELSAMRWTNKNGDNSSGSSGRNKPNKNKDLQPTPNAPKLIDIWKTPSMEDQNLADSFQRKMNAVAKARVIATYKETQDRETSADDPYFCRETTLGWIDAYIESITDFNVKARELGKAQKMLIHDADGDLKKLGDLENALKAQLTEIRKKRQEKEKLQKTMEEIKEESKEIMKKRLKEEGLEGWS